MSTKPLTREYESSHPWITFNLDLTSASQALWINLGEAASKCEHIAGVALDPAMAEKLLTLYMVKGANATTDVATLYQAKDLGC
jgi:hypothetical protein